MSSKTKTTFHRDGSVTVWNIFTQQWQRTDCVELVRETERSNAILPTLPEGERNRIIRTAERMS